MNNNLKNYLDNIKKPWGILFYRVLWQQLDKIKTSKVLDFGSGFGITANHFASNNMVIAIEPNSELVEARIQENDYIQIVGDLKALKSQKDNYFDVILCHNVFEYAKEREEIFKEFLRILKPGGIISLVKHNHAGRIMQKVVFENNIDEAEKLLNGGIIEVLGFGKVSYYKLEDIKKWCKGFEVEIIKVLGIRTFWALQQDNKIKEDPIWQEKMFKIEMMVSNIDEYVNISFFNHIILKKALKNYALE
ncbi:SAM-dependent methyltransferase [Clostridium acetobutylicum]|uniref:class I SAM-dependent methyltransferase n=1 Tax=Clostridium TaxID=1485 RepID=UPI000200C23B|nr:MULTISPECIES: class I SAM-dependent methyltransferase [Clostridium]ADZ21622.1 S-adenosylmethionine-dependent methyltransferase [Clostridium acetobutylicum EA 2018]NOV88351.1 SAM-dependent methyltransferase [Clostridium acetobutylicum]NOW13306.1 SAM-dependent methyltransferase [Clostridium acetobutylicum]NRY55682.1 SAM-dependent methyltransferase [Clostridium acetobutylicum]NSA92469.1 SAM-dependent methyltransferase [Clostridium acetobutylicum]